MAFFPVLSFLFLLVFGSVDSWAECTTFTSEYGQNVCYSGASCTCSDGMPGDGFYWANCRWLSGAYGRTCNCKTYCTRECEIDSLQGCPPFKVWSSSYCSCVDPPPMPKDTTWHCQNAGGPEPGGFGGPRVAKLFKCYDGSCHNTRDLSGSCQDWGFCEDGVDDCEIADSLGTPPCGRSGSRFITSPKCVYACADGKDLSCTPVSTGYVAGNIYAGECPSIPPDGCRPSSSSSGASSSGSSSPSSGASSSPSNTDWRDTINPGNGGQLDYTRILEAILDTLHRANVQRDFVLDLENNMSLDLDNISNYSEYNYQQLSNLNSKGSVINTALGDLNNTLVGAAGDLSTSVDLLGSINDYLRSDSLLSRPPGDTVYNPLLRDIKDALDSMSVVDPHDTSLFVRDSAFARWFAEYVQDSAAQRGVLGKIWDDIKADRDSVLSRSCTGFNECLAVYKRIDYCSSAWGVSTVDCVDGGTPFDNILNVEGSILSTLWEAIWGEDSTFVDTVSRLDTNVTFNPKKDTAESWLSRAFNALFSPESTQAMLQKVAQMKDSIDRAKRDTVKIQPDSLWLDSSQAAAYVQDMLLPPGTLNECWVCHADLGTLGGLAPNGLSIDIDFGDFGGFDFCAIIRAVVKIAAFVVCMSLTLGSWMAAFGYNPKNDA